MTMVGIQERLDADEPLNAMRSNQGEVLFNIPGVVKDKDGQFNILVVAFRHLGPGLSTVRLMYLDPKQYSQAVQQAAEKSERK